METEKFMEQLAQKEQEFKEACHKEGGVTSYTAGIGNGQIYLKATIETKEGTKVKDFFINIYKNELDTYGYDTKKIKR